MDTRKVGLACVEAVELSDGAGFDVVVVDRGAAIHAIRITSAERVLSVALSYVDTSDRLQDPYYLGATLGRYAGRIAHGRFDLADRTVRLETDAGALGHCLHGGPNGFHRQTWSIEAVGPRLARFSYQSRDGDQGFPGTLVATVTYAILAGRRLVIDFQATTDRMTIVNLTNHSYFNLNGAPDRPIDDHVVQVHASRYAPHDATQIPLGTITPVDGTPFDFRVPRTVGCGLGDPAWIEREPARYDHSFLLDGCASQLKLAASVVSPLTRLQLRVFTTQAALQFYAGDRLGAPFRARAGVCLEAQNLPDAPNQPGFPSPWLEPGQIYRERTVYEFSSVAQCAAHGAGGAARLLRSGPASATK